MSNATRDDLADLAERVENPDARVEKSSAAAAIDRNVRRTR